MSQAYDIRQLSLKHNVSAVLFGSQLLNIFNAQFFFVVVILPAQNFPKKIFCQCGPFQSKQKASQE